MGRLTEALNKSRAATAASTPPLQSEAPAIPFFDETRAPVSVPWNIGARQDGHPATSAFLGATMPTAVAQPERDERPSYVWPTGEGAEKLVVSPSIVPAAREWYRQLGASLHQGQLENGIGVVVVTSAVPGEGKTLTSANLALTLSESYQRRVLLIDADLRRPTVHTVLGLSNSVGLREALTSDTPLPLIPMSPHLSVLLAGSQDDDPMKTLASDRMRGLIRDVRTRFDWVLLDTPPVGQLPDAKVLVSIADVALLVIKAGRTSYSVAQAAADAIGKERIFGVVLNGAAEADTAALYGVYEMATRPR